MYVVLEMTVFYSWAESKKMKMPPKREMFGSWVAHWIRLIFIRESWAKATIEGEKSHQIETQSGPNCRLFFSMFNFPSFVHVSRLFFKVNAIWPQEGSYDYQDRYWNVWISGSKQSFPLHLSNETHSLKRSLFSFPDEIYISFFSAIIIRSVCCVYDLWLNYSIINAESAKFVVRGRAKGRKKSTFSHKRNTKEGNNYDSYSSKGHIIRHTDRSRSLIS